MNTEMIIIGLGIIVWALLVWLSCAVQADVEAGKHRGTYL